MVRWMLLLGCVMACKKAAKPEEAPPPGPPAVGHSVTTIKDDAGPGAEGTGSGSSAHPALHDAGPVDPDAHPDASRMGGNGAVAWRDAEGHLHGPGGPIFMGHGPDCDGAHDHCLRPGVWFSVGNIVPGKLYRAVPVFEFESKWWNWRGAEEETGKLLRTEAAKDTTLRAGQPVVWFSAETASKKWCDSEYEALTSSRWEAAVIDSVNSGAGTVRARGWPDEIPIDTARVVVEQK